MIDRNFEIAMDLHTKKCEKEKLEKENITANKILHANRQREIFKAGF